MNGEYAKIEDAIKARVYLENQGITVVWKT